MGLSSAERKHNYRRRLKQRLGIDPETNLRGKHGNHAKGPSHGRWSGERIPTPHGYIKVRVGTEHPLADPNGYAYEHLVVRCAAGNARPEVLNVR